MSNLDTLLLELAQEHVSDATAQKNIKDCCDIVSELQTDGAVIPTSAGVGAVDACTSTTACGRVLRVLLSSLDSNYLVKVGTCTRTSATNILISSLVVALRSSFVPSTEVSEDDQEAERKCIYTVLKKIIKFRSFEESVAVEVRSVLSSASDIETGASDDVTTILNAAFKAWDGLVVDTGGEVAAVKIEDEEGDAKNAVPDYTSGIPVSDAGLVTAMPVADNVYSPPSAVAEKIDMEDKIPFHKTRKFLIFACFSFVLAILLGTTISLAIVKPWVKGEGTLKPTSPPTSASTTERDKFMFSTKIYDKDRYDSDDENYKLAIDWIAYDDPAKITVDGPRLETRFALASFYFSTGGEMSWTNCTREDTSNQTCDDDGVERFLSESHECSWFGVTCAIESDEDKDEARAVTGLTFDYTGLNGTIPIDISYFKSMSVLSLVGNELYGAIPDTIGQLSDVTQFQMGENSFSGTLPESLFEIQSLETISFYQNYLYGTIPNVIGKMRNLKGFWMYDNYLSGTIPEDITNLDFLTYLDVKNNLLNGSFPVSLFELDSLQYVDVGANAFSPWQLPETFGAEKLTYIGVGASSLEGSLPESFYNLTQLKTILMAKNSLTGSISESVGRLESLKWFDVGYNELNGSIPSAFADLEELSVFIMRSNKITGGIPDSFDDMELNYLFLHYNTELRGNITEAVCNNTNLIITDCLDTFQDPLVYCDCCAYCCDADDESCILM